MFIETGIIIAFMTTLITELVVILSIQRPLKKKEWILAIVLVNCFTHPLAIYFLQVRSSSYLLVEMSVVVCEAILYCLLLNISIKRSLTLSFIVNIASIIAGIGIRFLFFK